MTYQIRDWDATYENDRSRSRKKCSFVCVPNKQHGMGFRRLMAEPDGAAIYGIFHCLVGACSQQEVRNGWLSDDGEQAVSTRGVDGEQAVTAWDAADMAVKFGRPVAEIDRALEVLSSPKIGWLILHKSIDIKDKERTHRALTVHSPSGHLEEKRIEEKRIGSTEDGVATLPTAPKVSRFEKPSREQVELQATKIGLPLTEVDKFLNHYESNGWKVGKNPMRSWTHAMGNWKANLANYAPNGQTPKAPTGPTLAEVREYAREKWGADDRRHSLWAASFFGYWAGKQWKKKGAAFDWKEELTKQVSQWRAA